MLNYRSNLNEIIIKSVFIVIYFQLTAFAIVHFRKVPVLFNPWITDSLFVGGEIITSDSLSPVVVKAKKSFNAAIGDLFFIDPETDSAIFISNNKNIDSSEIEIGYFPKNTNLTFMFIVTDTSSYYEDFFGKKIYTGQNRIGVDKYISERNFVNGGFGSRWAVIGKIENSSVEVGFEEKLDYAFRGIIFEVRNVFLLKKGKLPIPRLDSTSISQNYLNLSCPAVPESLVISDTIVTPVDLSKISIYFTTDGSDPRVSQARELYLSQITINKPCTLKAYATYENDTTWLSSDIAKWYFEGDITSVRNGKLVNYDSNYSINRKPARIFSINGRAVGYLSMRDKSIFSKMNPGVYLVRDHKESSFRKIMIDNK